jgi:hypothetical protein
MSPTSRPRICHLISYQDEQARALTPRCLECGQVLDLTPQSEANPVVQSAAADGSAEPREDRRARARRAGHRLCVDPEG